MHIPCEPIVVGDMQGVKCMMGMTESCHSVCCKCRARRSASGARRSRPAAPEAALTAFETTQSHIPLKKQQF